MHATYAFLINCPEEESEQVIQRADGLLDQYYKGYCDENNWATLMAIVFPSGRVVQALEDGDFRGRESFAQELIRDVPEAERWGWCISFVQGCQAYEVEGALHWLLNNYDTPLDMTRPDVHLRETIRDQALVAKPWVLQHAAKMLNVTSMLHDPLPFAELVTPYDDVRGMDLRDDSEASDYAIMFVDIHT